MKKFFKYCSFVILTILFFSLYNNIEAKDIEIHGTSWDKGIEFNTSIGALQSTYLDFEKNNKLGKKQWYNQQHTYVKPYGNDLYNNFTSGTTRSYSFVIHNKPFSTYSNEDVNDDPNNTYEYMYNYNVSGDDVSFNSERINVTGNNGEVEYIEFARFSDYYTIERKNKKGYFYYPFIEHNYFPKEYIDVLKKYLNRYMAGSDDYSYYFYISEPLAWKYPGSEMIAGGEQQRSVFEKDSINNRNVGLLTAKDVANIDKSAINSVGYYGLYTKRINHTYKNLADLFGISRN